MIKRKIGEFYAKIIGILLKPFLKLFKEALAEELSYYKRPRPRIRLDDEEKEYWFKKMRGEKIEKKGIIKKIINMCKS